MAQRYRHYAKARGDICCAFAMVALAADSFLPVSYLYSNFTL
jgi:hypothetical protein